MNYIEKFRFIKFNMFKYVITLFCMAFVFQDVSSQSESVKYCTTPDKNYGSCINLKDCQSLKQLVIKRKKTSEEVTFLKSSMCGYDNVLKDPKVCCPFQSMCGKSVFGTANRILGGRICALGDWPWMAAIGIKGKYKIQWLCGGALISNRFVLTAAHCTHKINVNIVRLGDLNLNDNIDDGADPVDIPIALIIKHHEYNQSSVTNDIALLKLEKTVTYSDLIQPVCLPSPPLFKNNSLFKMQPTVAGWGATKWKGQTSDDLLETTVSVYDENNCKRIFSNESKMSVIDNRVICAGDILGFAKDSCQGDSGGPLMWPKEGQFYVVGIVSYGIECGKKGVPGVYTRVSTFLNWITENMNKNLNA